MVILQWFFVGVSTAKNVPYRNLSVFFRAKLPFLLPSLLLPNETLITRHQCKTQKIIHLLITLFYDITEHINAFFEPRVF